MRTKQHTEESGFLSTILVIIAAILVLQFAFHVDVVGFLKSARVGEWVAYIKNVILALWNHVISPIVDFIKQLAN